MFILSFSISFVCLVVILLILSVFPLWYSAPAHSPSGNELNPPSYEDGHFSRGGSRTAATSVNYYTKRSILDVAAVLDPPLKLRCSIFISCVINFYLLFHYFISCVIPFWDSATAHSPSDKELKFYSLEKSCFSGLIVLLI